MSMNKCVCYACPSLWLSGCFSILFYNFPLMSTVEFLYGRDRVNVNDCFGAIYFESNCTIYKLTTFVRCV